MYNLSPLIPGYHCHNLFVIYVVCEFVVVSDLEYLHSRPVIDGVAVSVSTLLSVSSHLFPLVSPQSFL